MIVRRGLSIIFFNVVPIRVPEALRSILGGHDRNSLADERRRFRKKPIRDFRLFLFLHLYWNQRQRQRQRQPRPM